MNPITEGADHARGSEGTPIERTRKVGGGRESVAENRQAKAGAVAVPVRPARTLEDWLSIPAHDAQGRCFCGPAGCALEVRRALIDLVSGARS